MMPIHARPIPQNGTRLRSGFAAILVMLGLWLLPSLTLATGPARAAAEDTITVFAAASLGEALEEIGAQWPAPVTLSLGGSGAIARQVAAGAPADVVMLANTAWMDWLETRGTLRPGTRSAPVGNALVLIGPAGTQPLPDITAQTLLARLGPDGRLAMGEHRSVPAGIYARDWLIARNLWAALSPRLAETENVRAALALVARAEAPLGIVYRSDLLLTADVTALWDIPAAQQPDIRYGVAAITPQGAAFAAHLSTPGAADVFVRHGFIAPVP